jgi:hypothetical protein
MGDIPGVEKRDPKANAPPLPIADIDTFIADQSEQEHS